MNFGKGLSILIIVVYTIMSYMVAMITKINWIDIFNSLLLINILYHLLDWKYSWVGQEEIEEENNDDENNNN